jgi:hypothetical protein
MASRGFDTDPRQRYIILLLRADSSNIHPFERNCDHNEHYEAQSIWIYNSNDSIEMCVRAGDVRLAIHLCTADFDKDRFTQGRASAPFSLAQYRDWDEISIQIRLEILPVWFIRFSTERSRCIKPRDTAKRYAFLDILRLE